MAKKSKSTITIRTQFAVTTALVLLLVILGLFVAVLDAGNKKVGAPSVTETAETYGDVTIKGVGACLLKTGADEVTTADCAIGVMTASGLFYAVESDNGLTVDEQVELTGTLETDDDGTYDIEGTLVVKKD